ncbi:ABC transporter ATP-binding protein [Deinococcus metallilatus]|uniref:ABC transporter ATP-binding protein n=1 Tax=Deinococcus metallilatus TaxID=1211322 RepID=A0AAJ5JXJ9_9DEIO|nr:ABC transporter ATP-binding protein [Deinococcus metallilatus]MBB5294366.1 ABC-2 type transport system ATP-binding protein [Deinococcus metallilatus]QBY09132.1 ABC transporter ATP-binding protein [Deinococcus metallilatus]RXJ10276.1 ABC transporter ATP-binding protein [Deinococcus metallilatus]TLK22568.1 ABC transporter ATP-binding protein [Deinococcus metallilatus]GMA16297.1 ABC transporter [Deinococcus metallilatus]
MNAIETSGLSKLYRRGVGLHPLSLGIAAGEIFGFLGPNGAGKTTTIRTLLGFLHPTGGEARIFGRDVWREREAVHARVGYLPGEVHLPRDLSARELLERCARLRGTHDITYGLEVARRLELDIAPRLGTLSKGNRQKVGLVLALMPRPDLLMLDEPTDGLDPLAQETVLELLREARAEGRTVFLSSHVLSEVERVADRVGIIRRGQLVRVDELAVLTASLPQRVQVRFAAPPRVNLAALPGMAEGRTQGLDFQGLWRGGADALIRALAPEPLVSFSLVPSTLEDAFLGEYRLDEDRPDSERGGEVPHVA